MLLLLSSITPRVLQKFNNPRMKGFCGLIGGSQALVVMEHTVTPRRSGRLCNLGRTVMIHNFVRKIEN